MTSTGVTTSPAEPTASPAHASTCPAPEIRWGAASQSILGGTQGLQGLVQKSSLAKNYFLNNQICLFLSHSLTSGQRTLPEPMMTLKQQSRSESQIVFDEARLAQNKAVLHGVFFSLRRVVNFHQGCLLCFTLTSYYYFKTRC